MSWLSALTGMDALHNASVLNQSAKGLQQQAVGQYNAAAPAYGNLQNAGASDYNIFASQFLPYMNLFNQTAGIPGSIGGQLYQMPVSGGYGSPYYNAPASAQGGIGTASAAYGGQAPSQSARTGMVGGNTRTPPATQPMTNTGAAAPSSSSGYDAYALTPAQQTQLNNQVGVINTAMNSALAQHQQQYAARGQAAPPLEAALIREHFQTQAQNARANFAEAARANRQQALSDALNLFTGLGARGEGVYGAGAQGVENLGNQYANLALGNRQAAQQESGTAFNNLMGLLSLGGYAAGGGFNRPRFPTIQAGTPPIAGVSGNQGGVSSNTIASILSGLGGAWNG